MFSKRISEIKAVELVKFAIQNGWKETWSSSIKTLFLALFLEVPKKRKFKKEGDKIKILRISEIKVYTGIRINPTGVRISSGMDWGTRGKERLSENFRDLFRNKYYEKHRGTLCDYGIYQDVKFSLHFKNGEEVSDDWDAFGDNRHTFAHIKGRKIKVKQIRNIGYSCTCGSLMGVAQREALYFSDSCIINSPEKGACLGCGSYEEAHQGVSWKFYEEKKVLVMLQKLLT